MSATPGPAHRIISSVRSPTSTSAAPQTPLRSLISTFGSPSALRAEEECIVIEFGSRYLRVGSAGQALPQAVLNFGREEQRRAGDLRRWAIDYDSSRWRRTEQSEWGAEHELWKPDLRNVDMGLVGDKIERAVRDAFTRTILIDSRPRKFILAIPSQLPLPLLSTILDTLFTNFQPPNISLMSAPVLTTMAAGLRSGLVVDIGWAETVVTSIYEYREVQCIRSVRASKMLGEAMFKTLSGSIPMTSTGTKEDFLNFSIGPSFEECEEILERMAWCKPSNTVPQSRSFVRIQPRGLFPLKEEEESRNGFQSQSIQKERKAEETTDEKELDSVVVIPLRSAKPPKTVELRFSELAEPCERALFATGISESDLDDEELPLHLLVYRSLLKLPVDVRSMCMARVMFVGGASQIPGLKARVLDEVASLVAARGWDPVKGKAVDDLLKKKRLYQKSSSRQDGPVEVIQVNGTPLASTSHAAFADQEPDLIEEKLKREARKGLPSVESGNIRAVKSLGAWSGGSLMSQLKVQAISVVDREQWLQHGVSGASKSTEFTVVPHRQSTGSGSLRPGVGDRSSWTLGLWG